MGEFKKDQGILLSCSLSCFLKKKKKEFYILKRIGKRNLYIIKIKGGIINEFKHTGLFPEQAVNWDFMMEKIEKSNREVKVLNLFAYTGGASVACLSRGASVVHVDSSRGMVDWAKENVH